MGTEYYLVHKKSKEFIHCGRASTFKDAFTGDEGMYSYLRVAGLTKYIIDDVCVKMICLNNIEDSFYHFVIKELSKFDDDDVFILVSENDELLND